MIDYLLAALYAAKFLLSSACMHGRLRPLSRRQRFNRPCEVDAQLLPFATPLNVVHYLGHSLQGHFIVAMTRH